MKCVDATNAETYTKRPGNRCRDLFLHIEYLTQLTVIALRPDRESILNIGELNGYSNAVALLTDAALENRRHIELAVRRIETVSPSLEDVFTSLVRAEGGAVID